MDGKETINMCQVQLLYYHSHNHSLTHSSTNPKYPLTNSLTYTTYHSLTHSLCNWPTFTHPIICSLSHSFTHLPIHPLSILSLHTVRQSHHEGWMVRPDGWLVQKYCILSSGSEAKRNVPLSPAWHLDVWLTWCECNNILLCVWNHKSFVTLQLCFQVTWRIRMFRNKMLRRKFGYKAREVREQRKLHYGELHNFYFSFTTIKVLLQKLNQEVCNWWGTGQTIQSKHTQS